MKKLLTKSLIASMSRREVLGFIGGTATVSLVGCFREQSASVEATTVTTPKCVVRPEQTEGPYFVDEKLNRSDIRADPSNGSVKPGVPLRLVFQVSQSDRPLGGAGGNRACTPLSGALVDVWHCDAQGIYSDVNERRFNTVGKKFLRGYQVTDTDGVAQFVTIYPGYYPGRAVHIHFKIRTNSAQQSYEFTSQLYFDDALTEQIHEQPPYTREGQRLLNNQDGIFQNGGEQLTLQLTSAAEGYTGKLAIGLE